jgi:hypothetical protein
VENALGSWNRSETWTADRILTAALEECPKHSGVLQALAELRFSQGRYADAEELADGLVTLEPDSNWGWDLLGSSRYLIDDPKGALDAWNRIGRPVVREVRVEGLDQASDPFPGIRTGWVLTPERMLREERQLTDFPAVEGARLAYRPLPGGGAALDAFVLPAPSHPFTSAQLPGHLIRAVRGEVELGAGGFSGPLERGVLAAWKDGSLDHLSGTVSHAAPVGGGVWLWRVGRERGRFETAPQDPARVEVRDVRVAARWSWVRRVHPGIRGIMNLGFEDRETLGRGPAGGVLVGFEGEPWTFQWEIEAGRAGESFLRSRADAELALSLGNEFDVEFRGGGSLVSSQVPPDLQPRFGADRSATHLMRAGAAVDSDGVARMAYPGRRWVTGGGEIRRWTQWPLGQLLGVAVFVDGVRSVGGGEASGPRGGVHLGGGLRVRIPGLRDRLRMDWAMDPMNGGSRLSAALMAPPGLPELR